MQQGTSVVVPLFTIENYHSNLYRKGFYIFSPIRQLILKFSAPENGQSIKRLETYNNISDHITYEMSPVAYSQGLGVGQSIIADFYDFFKIFGIVIFSICFAILLKYISINCVNGLFNTVISFFFLNSVIMIPRGYALSILFYVPEIIFLFLIYNFLKVINLKYWSKNNGISKHLDACI